MLQRSKRHSKMVIIGENTVKLRIWLYDETKEVYDETATLMASTSYNVNKTSKSGSGRGSKSLYEQWKESHDSICSKSYKCGDRQKPTKDLIATLDPNLTQEPSQMDHGWVSIIQSDAITTSS
ncbi:hypothetical protein Tco_0208386 [Tanacetum coccineum]